jgi:hypothetical protein
MREQYFCRAIATDDQSGKDRGFTVYRVSAKSFRIVTDGGHDSLSNPSRSLHEESIKREIELCYGVSNVRLQYPIEGKP